jgi:hypothetical protein
MRAVDVREQPDRRLGAARNLLDDAGGHVQIAALCAVAVADGSPNVTEVACQQDRVDG